MIKHNKNITNKKFLITGVAGFVGSSIAKEILLLEGKVVGIDNLATKNLKNIEELQKQNKFKFYQVDLLNYKKIEKLCKNIDYIIHEADLILVDESIKNPYNYLHNNINSMINILEAARVNEVKKVIYASSAAVYGDKKVNKENVKSEEKSSYGLTKKLEEDIAKFYTKQYKVNTVGLRYFNIYGENQNLNSKILPVIPTFIRDISKYNKVCIYGSKNIERDFVYIKDIVNANLLACIADRKANGKVFNIGSGYATSLHDLANLIQKLLNIQNISIEIQNKRKGDIEKSVANIENSKKYLKYIPQYTLEEGLKQCINWYIENI